MGKSRWPWPKGNPEEVARPATAAKPVGVDRDDMSAGSATGGRRGRLRMAAIAIGIALLVVGMVLVDGPISLALVVQIAGLGLVAVAAFAVTAGRSGDVRVTPGGDGLNTLRRRVENGIEKLKDLQWELSDNESRYRDLLDAQTDIITRRDTRGRLTFVNRAFCRTFGVEAGIVLGTSFEPEVAHREGGGRRSSPEPGRRQRFDEQVMTAGGLRWFAFEQQAIAGDDGRVHEIQLLGRDVTEQRRTQQALAEARDQAEAANRAKSRFLAAMSHEIRTPMNGILGMTSLLGETVLTGEQRSYLNAVEISAKNLLTIINEILDLSKIEAGKLDVHPAPFALDECLRSVIELMAPRAEGKGLDLAWRIEPELPRMVVGDETRVRQILLNLVGNAIKFTEAGGVAVRVKRWPSPEPFMPDDEDAIGPHGFGMVFEVEDTGPGVAASQARRIFSEFEQADDMMRRKPGGTGLGLAISRRLARAMGGDIEVRSAPGQGSTFTARITVLAQPSSPPVLATHGDPSARHVLIVSSRMQQRTLMQETLHSLGIASTIASLGGAMEMATAAPGACRVFDTVIADAEEGVEAVGLLISRLRGDGGRSPRAVLVIDQPGGERLRPFRTAGCDAYLVRPVRPNSLLTQIEVPTEGTTEGTRRPAEPAMQPPVDAKAEAPGYRRILLVEDNEINALLARRMCEKSGCLVHHAPSGAAALAWCADQIRAHEGIDLVLMDIHMPAMDGFETLRGVRRLYEANGTLSPPIVSLTANAFAEDRKQCLDAGFDDYLAKPFDRAELDALLQKWCAAEGVPRDGLLGDCAA